MRPFTLLPWPRALRSAHARARLRVYPLALLLTVPACDAVLNPADPVDHATVVGEREHIAIPDVLAESANIVPDDTPYLPGYHRGQVRVIINEGEVDEEMALYTVSEVFDPGAAQQVDVFVWDDPNNGASTDGKERLELGAGALSGSPLPAVVLEDTVTTHACTDSALSYGLVECLRGDAITIMNMSESYLFIAPHGGAIELHTDDQARAAHSHTFVDGNMMNFDMEDHSLAWYLNGWRSGGGAYRHWHITSTEIGRRSFPQLDLIGPKVDNLFNGFTYAVAFHGMSDDGLDEYSIYVGGGADTCILDEVVDTLTTVLANEVDVDVQISPDADLRGDSPDNLVNWLTLGGAGGIQLEQTISVRDDYGDEVAMAVAELLPTLSTLCP